MWSQSLPPSSHDGICNICIGNVGDVTSDNYDITSPDFDPSVTGSESHDTGPESHDTRPESHDTRPESHDTTNDQEQRDAGAGAGAGEVSREAQDQLLDNLREVCVCVCVRERERSHHSPPSVYVAICWSGDDVRCVPNAVL